ncbi:sodium:proton antiporter [Candidatus Parcubacteria bacterium]|nr:MAG: sodium:proton antiporter [Candidatus Parcubacteria bacterium]
MVASIASVIFLFGYFFITIESRIGISKSAFALATGGILWTLVALIDSHIVTHEFPHVAYDIFNIVVFLLAAMSLVEILVHYRLFDVVRDKILARSLSNKAQFVVIGTVAFFLSAIIDNLTTTIVMIQIARKFFSGNNLLVATVGIVIMANAGGAFSPIGDITTIMLWLAGKFEATQIVLFGFLPSLTLMGIATALMLPQIRNHSIEDSPAKSEKTVLSRSEKIVITVVLGSFLLPLLAKTIHLPPVLGLLLGLGISWVLIDGLKMVSKRQTHLSASIEHLLQKTDIGSIKFFIGILLAVSALNALGVLATVSGILYGETPSTTSVIIGNIVMGIASALVDNIPLTAIAIDMLDLSSPVLWVLLALAVGTGGSLLAIGSAAGVVAVGMVKELTFEKYFKIAAVPALASFAACMLVWYAQYVLFF